MYNNPTQILSTSAESSPAPPGMTTSVSTPSPAIFLSQPLIQEGIFANLITSTTSLTTEQANELKLPTDCDAMYNAKHPLYPTWGRTYGGVYIAQSMACALLTLNDPTRYYIHQLQSVFVAGGTEGQDIQYTVNIIKNTKAFINCRVDAYQLGRLLFTGFISFVTPNESNVLSHTRAPSQIDFQALPHPDTVPLYTHDLYNMTRTSALLKDPFRQKMVLSQSLTMPITTKLINREYIDVKYFLADAPQREPRQLLYVRYPNPQDFMFTPTDELKSKFTPKEQQQQQEQDKMQDKMHVSLRQQLSLIGLGYASDYNMIPLTVRPHKVDAFPLNIQFASLNHNITFLTPDVDIFNDWLIFETTAPFLSNSRCQLMGTFYTRDGKAVAYVTQEALARVLSDETNVVEKFPNPMTVGQQMAERTKAKHGGTMPGPFGMNMDMVNKQRQAKL